MMRAIFLTILSVSISLGIGCAKIEPPVQKTSLTFPKSRIAVDAVGLDIGVAQLDSSQSKTFETFWGLLDQQELPLERRKVLDRNGLRVAIMSSHAPPQLNQLVDPPEIDPDLLNEFERQLFAKGLLRPQTRMLSHERISNREGQAHKVETSEVHREISWVIQADDQQTAGSGKLVRGVISVTTYPQGDGSVRLIVRPEIHHGQSRPRIGAGQGSFLVESSQFITPLDELKFELNLRSGESLVIAPTKDVSDMGKILFGTLQTAGNSVGLDSAGLDSSAPKKPVATHRMLLIRVVQTQMDDLFSDSNLNEKLTTTPMF